MIETKYIELSEKIEEGIRKGRWKERLPGTVKLSRELSADPATVLKAFRYLSEKGLVTIQGTKGTYISKTALSPAYKRIGILDAMTKGFKPDEKRTLQKLCTQKGYELFTIEYDNANSPNGIAFISSMPVDGFILNYKTVTSELVFKLREAGKHFVSVNQVFELPGVSWVDFNNKAVIEKALELLAENGRKRISLISFKWGLKEHHEELKAAYMNFMNKAGVSDERLWYAEKDYMEYYNIYGDNAYFELGKEAVDYLAKLEEPPDAMLVMSEWIASGAYPAVLSHGFKIPEDISFLIYSTQDAGECRDAVQYSKIGYSQRTKIQRAIEILMELLENPGCGPVQELLPFDFVKGLTI